MAACATCMLCSRILRPQFVVKSREENVSIQLETYEAEQINEYSNSQSDLVTYKAQEGLKSMDCCVISLEASTLVIPNCTVMHS